ncbi:hypothetical protein [Streptomyces flaveolus]|uniref:hypothetical protein n=1 Tax=Streptomyces flaveolus TaxID=67297 RepID=UPI003436AE5D
MPEGLRSGDHLEVHCGAFHADQHLALQAGAGTGKTTTLAELARITRRRGRYLAHNRGRSARSRSLSVLDPLLPSGSCARRSTTSSAPRRPPSTPTRGLDVAGGHTKIDRAAESLGWTPKPSLEDGIRSALAWIPVRDELLKG